MICKFDPAKLLFEFTGDERMCDVPQVLRIIGSCRARGFATAINDFGIGYPGLRLLAELGAGHDEAGHGVDPRDRALQRIINAK